MVQRVITTDNLTSDWDTVKESVVTPDDAIIVEENGEPRFAIVSFERYKQAVERERQDRFEDARRRWDALAASLAERNRDLTPEMIEEWASRDWDAPDPGETSGRAGSIQTRKS